MARKVGQIDRIGHDYKVVLPNGPDLDRVPPFLISGSQGSSHLHVVAPTVLVASLALP